MSSADARTDEYDPWYVCMNPYCKFETNSFRSGLNHELEGGRKGPRWLHPVERVEGDDD